MKENKKKTSVLIDYINFLVNNDPALKRKREHLFLLADIFESMKEDFNDGLDLITTGVMLERHDSAGHVKNSMVLAVVGRAALLSMENDISKADEKWHTITELRRLGYRRKDND